MPRGHSHVQSQAERGQFRRDKNGLPFIRLDKTAMLIICARVVQDGGFYTHFFEDKSV
jgi:hypothetical protein